MDSDELVDYLVPPTRIAQPALGRHTAFARGVPSRSAEFVYGVMNLRDDEVGYTAALATQPHR